MYTKIKPHKTTLNVNKTYVGETIEQKINRITNNKEPIKDGAPLTYTERKDGVQAQYNIRTDRFEIALDAMDAVSKTFKAKRENKIGEEAKKNMEKEALTEKPKDNAGSEPAQTTT